MNTRLVLQWLVLLMLGLSLQSVSAQPKVASKVLACKLGVNQSAILLRDHRIADTYVYYLQKQDVRTMLFADNEDDSRGRAVVSRCLGDKERILLVSGEFSSNYIKGLVLRYNRQTGQWERIDFAERARPTRIYLGARQMSVVIPNHGHETDKKYLIYSYVSGKGQPEDSTEADSLPSADGLRMIRIDK